MNVTIPVKHLTTNYLVICKSYKVKYYGGDVQTIFAIGKNYSHQEHPLYIIQKRPWNNGRIDKILLGWIPSSTCRDLSKVGFTTWFKTCIDVIQRSGRWTTGPDDITTNLYPNVPAGTNILWNNQQVIIASAICHTVIYSENTASCERIWMTQCVPGRGPRGMENNYITLGEGETTKAKITSMCNTLLVNTLHRGLQNARMERDNNPAEFFNIHYHPGDVIRYE